MIRLMGGLLLAVFMSTVSAYAAEPTFPAQTCAFADVQTAVSAAIATGVPSLVTIPTGTCDWSSSELVLPGDISLKGGGKFLTVLRGSAPSNDALVTVNCVAGKTARISDLSMIGKANPAIWDGGLALKGGCKDFKVSKVRFQDFIYFGLGVWGDSRGVIYQNEFANNYRVNPNGGNAGYGVVVYGDSTWPALSLGTANAVFVEDNYFVGNRHHIASNDGSRYVFRYNTAVTTSAVRDFPAVDAHGKGSATRGSRSWEIYNNTFSTNLAATEKARSMIGIRGGDGVIFSNTLLNSLTVNGMIELSALDVVLPYPSMDQLREGYFWNNCPDFLVNGSSTHFVEGRDYFKTPKPGYIPYTYPHPLRTVTP